MSKERGEIVLYQAADGGPALDVRLERESIWLTQVQMAELFGVNVPAVFTHIKNIYATGELETDATVSKMEIVRQEGSRVSWAASPTFLVRRLALTGLRRPRRVQLTLCMLAATNTG